MEKMTLIILSLLILLTVNLLKTSSGGNPAIDLEIEGEECGAIHKMGDNLTIVLTIRINSSNMFLWLEFPDKSRKILREGPLEEGTYKFPLALIDAPPGLWVVHAVATAQEGYNSSATCSILVLSETISVTDRENMESSRRNLSLKLITVPTKLVINEEKEIRVEVINGESRVKDLELVCEGGGLLCVPGQRKLKVEPFGNVTVIFEVLSRVEGNRSLIISLYDNGTFVLSRKFIIQVVRSSNKGSSDSKDMEIGNESKSSDIHPSTITKSPTLTNGSEITSTKSGSGGLVDLDWKMMNVTDMIILILVIVLSLVGVTMIKMRKKILNQD